MFKDTYRILINIFVELFIKKEKRGAVRYNLIGFFNRLAVKNKAKSVGKNFGCTGKYEVRVTRNTIIKDNVGINGMVILGGGRCEIGTGVIIGQENLIITDNHDYEGENLPFGKKSIEKKVVIGDYVWLGARVTLLPGTHIGEGAIIQAGAVVHGEIPPCAIAGGNPAKVFKYRDEEHFQKLKALKEQRGD